MGLGGRVGIRNANELLENLLNFHVEATFQKAESIYQDFKLDNPDELREIKDVIKHYFFNAVSQQKYNTVANAAVFYVLKKSNSLLGYNYFHEKFRVDSGSLKTCYKMIKKIEENL